MVHKHYPPAAFVADAIALDFVNSTAKAADGIDSISDGDHLLDWLEQAKLVPREASHAIRRRAAPGELDKVAGQARNLREWFQTFVRKTMGRPLSPNAFSDLEPLNRLLEGSVSYNQLIEISNRSRSFELRSVRRWRSPESLLLPIADVLARFVCDEDFSNVKTCEGSGCSLLFADHTRGRSRRWCSMAVCGNRAKVQAHRDRARLTNNFKGATKTYR